MGLRRDFPGGDEGQDEAAVGEAGERQCRGQEAQDGGDGGTTGPGERINFLKLFDQNQVISRLRLAVAAFETPLSLIILQSRYVQYYTEC